MKRVPLICYHAHCNDGLGAAYAAWLIYGEIAEYRPLRYTDKMPTPDEVIGREVIVMDFSFEPKLIDELAYASSEFTLLDHHKSSMDAWTDHAGRPRGLTRNGYVLPNSKGVIQYDLEQSGAVLAWKHFHPTKPVPTMLNFVQEYDLGRTFNNTASPGTESFIRRLDLEPLTIPGWSKLIELTSNAIGFTEAFIQEGNLLTTARNRMCDEVAAQSAVPVTIKGITGLAVNGGQKIVNELGALLANKSNTFGMLWTTDGANVKISLRANNRCDVSAIAVQYGCGGHPNAAGIEMPLTQFLAEVKFG